MCEFKVYWLLSDHGEKGIGNVFLERKGYDAVDGVGELLVNGKCGLGCGVDEKAVICGNVDIGIGVDVFGVEGYEIFKGCEIYIFELNEGYFFNGGYG